MSRRSGKHHVEHSHEYRNPATASILDSISLSLNSIFRNFHHQTLLFVPPLSLRISLPLFCPAPFHSLLGTVSATPPHSTKSHQREDSELSIFDAQKYFNDQCVHEHKLRLDPSAPRLSSVSSIDGSARNYRTPSFNATPTASSEASWNSLTGLLSNPPGSLSVSLNAHPTPSDHRRSPSLKWLFRRKCPCSGKKAVDVEEKLHHHHHPAKSDPNPPVANTSKHLDAEAMAKLKLGGAWAKEQPPYYASSEPRRISPEARFPADVSRRIVPSGRFPGDAGFSFPILGPPPPPTCDSPPEDPFRESLEVFRPADFPPSVVGADRSCRGFNFPAAVEDDVASDSSSDLFEIESFSTQTTMYPTYGCGGGGGSPSVAGILQFLPRLDDTESVAPSEVSVDWSVTTAEGFDRSSGPNFSASVSEFEAEAANFGGGGSGGGAKKKSPGLLSCRCEKAVSVGPTPIRCGPDHVRVGPSEGTAKIAAMSRLAQASSGHVPRLSDSYKPPLARSNSARLPRTLATR